MDPIHISPEKAILYRELLKKYAIHSFNGLSTLNKDEFLQSLKTLIDEKESEIDFEVKLCLLNMLVAGIPKAVNAILL